ncbi:YfiR family protein [Candidatus Poribacteria bacterium]|nr:YfiR family protein [Candidatus Poribacteria bacterium]
MKLLMLCVFVSSVLFSTAVFAQKEIDTYNAAIGIEDASKRIEALKAFIKDYPNSEKNDAAHLDVLRTYLELDNVDAGEKYLATMPESLRGSAYNALASKLADQKMRLDVANQYATLAVKWGRSSKDPRLLAMVLDTHAYVFFQIGNVVKAEELQREAISHVKDRGYMNRFAQYEETVGKLASFLLKALSYDRNLKKRSPDGIRIAVVYKANYEKTPVEVVNALNKAGADKVEGLTVEATALEFKSAADLLKQVEAKKFNALYIHPSMATAVSSIQQVTQGKKIPSLGSSKELVEEGASLGVYLVEGKPELVVNLKASRDEGLDLDAKLLRVSKVIK